MAGSTQIKTDGLAAINLSRGFREPKMQYAIPKQNQLSIVSYCYSLLWTLDCKKGCSFFGRLGKWPLVFNFGAFKSQNCNK